MSRYSFADYICLTIDQTLRTLLDRADNTGATYPAHQMDNPSLSSEEKRHAAGLMRVNHAGEICAQALYHGQAVVARNPEIREKLLHAAREEGDHLSWCQTRLTELNSHPSYLNPLWYAGSFAIGLTAGMIGDQWSLGFIVETERQVIKHLENHAAALPLADKKSAAILQQMTMDEALHRDEAIRAGAKELPGLVKKMMTIVSKIMVKTAYWI